ncbi:hypothetical protein, partial [Pseudomonas sp. MPR-R1B]|uniref:hypothetical protein n=2 Tax=Pseudomonadota TaxID=1224 RepID=UPI001C483FB2
ALRCWSASDLSGARSHRADMASPRALLGRVAKLEQAKVPVVLRLIGSIEQFESDVMIGVANGTLDRRDMNAVVASVRRWVK